MADVIIKSLEDYIGDLIGDLLALERLEQHIAQQDNADDPVVKAMLMPFYEQRKSFLRRIYPALLNVDMESEEFQQVLNQMLPKEKHESLRKKLLEFYQNLERLVSA